MTLKDYINLKQLSTKKNKGETGSVGFLTPQPSSGQFDIAPTFNGVSSPRQKKTERPKP
jgi:hypothetical protein